MSVGRVNEPDVSSVATRAVEALGLCGPVTVDVRRRFGGEPVVLGVSARVGDHSADAPEILDALLADQCARLTSRMA
jgi:hypothetical protein